uniref:Si:ch211-188p14.4 n=1 Tax=Neogobius melanostomus TaxID=47308 RepID=A0A8C6TZP1_9GOBI
DEMATEIPMSQLVFTKETLNISVVNKKKWTSAQVLSSEILQGFTCTTVRKASKSKIKNLVHACRPRKGRKKVALKESQLTCMYNLLDESLNQNFNEYPADMLLYFNSKDVEKTNCRSYFSAVGAADFSVSSPILNKGQQLFSEARGGISGFNLGKEEVSVLGSLSCRLNSSYIQNSDPSILENLKSCQDFSESQVAAMETLLLSGKTSYGNVTTWNKQTLQNLAPLPLYLTENVWSHIQFLHYILTSRKNHNKEKLKSLFKHINPRRVKRGAGCTVGNVTSITVRDPSFPFGYDLTQFDLCLDVPVLKENLNFICEKVDDDSFQEVILRKLNEAYPSGVSEENVQVLNSVSRSATLSDISKWSITKIDTLSALMKPEDGSWEAAKSNAVITKYLDTPGNSLGTSELNAIDANICSLDVTVIKNITPENLRNAKSLNVESCSLEQKRVLYEISNTSFSSQRSNPTNHYNLINNYLGKTASSHSH